MVKRRKILMDLGEREYVAVFTICPHERPWAWTVVTKRGPEPPFWRLVHTATTSVYIRR